MPSPLKEPPGPLNADAWTILFTVAQQLRIVDEFAALNGCVVYHPTGTAFWNLSSRAESGLPLVNFVQHNFKTVRSMGDYQFQPIMPRAIS